MNIDKVQKRYRKVELEYRKILIKKIKKLLIQIPDNELKLFDNECENGLGGFPYTDVLPKIDKKGNGVLYTNIDCISVAYEGTVSIYQECNIIQLEKIYEQLL